MTAAGESGAAVFTAEGSTTSDSAIWYLIVFGVLGAITMVILGFAIPDAVGSPWIYAAALVGFLALGWWAIGRGSVKIRLVEDGDALRVIVEGRSVAVDARLRPGYRHWYRSENIPVRLGGGVMMHFALVVETDDGRRLAFRQMGGSDDAGWPAGRERLGDGRDTFLCLSIFSLEKALRQYAEGARAGGA